MHLTKPQKINNKKKSKIVRLHSNLKLSCGVHATIFISMYDAKNCPVYHGKHTLKS